MTDDLTVIFALLEFMRVKDAHITYINLTPDASNEKKCESNVNKTKVTISRMSLLFTPR